MKKRRVVLYTLILSAILLPSAFPIFWKNNISLPLLRLLNAFGGRIPFCILEALAVGLALWLLFPLRRLPGNAANALRSLARRVVCLSLTFLAALSWLWLPLYSAKPETALPDADALARSCERLICELNASPLDFSALPEELPAKFIRFPFWMRALNISGFYSFFTGEALISPEQPACAIPFVAVHESMHGRGIAGEGECNVAAWEECMALGGVYADSARLWALRYVLADLRAADPAAHSRCLNLMLPHTQSAFYLCGGEYVRPRQTVVQAAFSQLGGSATQDYEFLSAWLAGQSAQCYNSANPTKESDPPEGIYRVRRR